MSHPNEATLAELLKQCEDEPIRIPGMIQPHGLLMTLRQSDLTILQISESVYELCGIQPHELLHQPLTAFMNTDPVEKAAKRLGDRVPRLLNPIPIDINVNGKKRSFDGILHRAGRILILELERHIPDEKAYGGFGGFYEAVREVTSKMMITDSLQDVLDLACEELRKLTGFARVLAYKFDGDWNGLVIAESREESVPSLLKHHFPASDIPKQARELYTTNWLRLIPDVDYQPSKIVPPINPITDRPLDLSNSVLRSVSPVHLEYMRNMGQAASMSVSLLRGKQLWGLISCHHPEAKFLKYDVRVASEFIGQMVSAQIVAREESAEVDHKLQLKKLYDDLLRNGGLYSAIPASFSANSATVLALADATGVAIFLGDTITTLGRTPPKKDLDRIRDWIVSGGEAIFASQSLKGIGNPESIDPAARGVLSITIPRGAHTDAIIWFRSEERDQFKWAGDPAAKTIGPDGKIHPRASFETWYAKTEGSSKKWLAPEFEAADELRRALMAMANSTSPETKIGEHFRASLNSAIVKSADRSAKRSVTQEQAERTHEFQSAALDSRLLLEGFSEFAVLFLDRKGNIQNWSLGARRLLGYESSSVLGRSLNTFLAEDDALRGRLDKILESVQTHDRAEEELWLYRDDKSSFWGKLLAAPVHSDEGNVIGYSVVVQDITTEKSAEEELKAVKSSAEAANQAKSAFLANISHEIRTPLGAVLGFAELMSQPRLSDEDKLELYGKVRRNGDQLTTLINDLLDISKIEAGKVDVEVIETDLQVLLFDVIQLLSQKAEEGDVSLRTVVSGQVPKYICTDPTRLRQILINLLSNAIKFTPKGGKVTLEVAQRRANNGESLVIRVIDTGKGMSEAQMAKLFKPFVQADVSTTREFGGTGLGLFLSKRLARALGGDLSIESSKIGEGSTFVAHIDPGQHDSRQTFKTVERTHQPSVRPMTGSEDLAGFRILLVDDSADNRDLITTFLRKAGAVVETADNGKLGSLKAFAGDYDIVLMDVQMPVMDGNSAMMYLKEKGYRRPVIALTAHAMREEKINSLAAGFADYLTKPVDRKHLIQRIREILA